MKLIKGHASISPAEWRKVQHAGKDLQHEVKAPADTCSRCKTIGQMHYASGHPLCDDCASQTVFQPPIGTEEAAMPAYIKRMRMRGPRELNS